MVGAVAAWLSVPLFLVGVLATLVGPSTLLWSLPHSADTVHHGLLLWWPLTVAVTLTTCLNASVREFAATIFTRQNAERGRPYALSGLLAFAVLPPLLLRPLWLPLAIAALVGVSGWSVRRHRTRTHQPVGSVGRVGWSLTWRLLAMAVPLYLAMFGYSIAIGAVALAPGMAVVSALQEDPSRAEALQWASTGLPSMIRAYGWALLAGTLALSATWTVAGVRYIPGHVARRADAEGAFEPDHDGSRASAGTADAKRSRSQRWPGSSVNRVCQ